MSSPSQGEANGATRNTYNKAGYLVKAEEHNGTIWQTQSEMRYDGLGNRLEMTSYADGVGETIRYQLDNGQPLAAVGTESTSYYLYGRGVIGTKMDNWAYILQDGLGSTRQLATHEGVIAMSVAYTPWGDVLEYYGSGGIDFGYLGGIYDENTGLIYLGGGKYYDPVTGRMLTRGAGQSNPYKPGAFDPAGMMVAPLAMLGLVLGRKKKRGKWDSFIVLLVVCVVVGMSVSACNLTKTDSIDGEVTGTATIYVSTPTGTTAVTVTATATPTSTPTVKSTIAPAAAAPTQVETSITHNDCYDSVLGMNIILTEYPLKAGLPISFHHVWETYRALYLNKWDSNNELYWWWIEVDETGNRIESFTPLDFLDRLLQFEFHPLRGDDRVDVPEIAVGNFCFWTTRNEDWTQNGECDTNPDSLTIFDYIGRRKLVTDFANKNYTATEDDVSIWVKNWPEVNRTYLDYPLVGAFQTAPSSWKDWRNAKNPSAEDDVPVEWGNDTEGHYEAFYNNVNQANVTRSEEEKRQTKNIFLYVDRGEQGAANFYAFTFCQKIYLESGIPMIDANCDSNSRNKNK